MYREIGKSTIIIGNLTTLSVINRTCRQKISKDMDDPNMRIREHYEPKLSSRK